MEAADRARQGAHEAEQQARPWVVRLARIGFAAKGIVYLIIGVLAVRAAFGGGGTTTDTKGALVQIITQPFGEVLLAAVAVGLAGYALWRLVEAIYDPEQHGEDAKGAVVRGAYIVSAVIYAGLAYSALKLVTGGSGQGKTPEDWTAMVMQHPLGRWAVAAAGVAVIGAALYEFYQAWSTRFRRKLRLHEMTPGQRTWAIRIGRAGLAARGVVFAIIGWFLLRAALTYDPQQAAGLGEALRTLAGQGYGTWLLAIVAAGLAAYGVHCLVQARYRRIYLPAVERHPM